jgi:hypothetical protein
MRSRGTVAVGLLVALANAACGTALRELEGDGVSGPVAIDGCASALALRFGPIELDRALRAARPRFARDSLSPSRLLDDPALWTRRDATRRWLDFGSPGGIPYRMGARRPMPASPRPGSHRGSIRLEALGSGDFEWDVREDLTVGRVPTRSLARAASALLLGLESQTSGSLLDLAGRALPRSSAAFGRLFTLEPIHLAPAAAGGDLVSVGVRLEPARLSVGFPRYARFLEEYLAPSRFRLVVADENGLPYLEFMTGGNRLDLRFRVFRGALGPLLGPPRPMPDRLRATTTFSVTSGVFRVGVENLVAEVGLVSSSSERGFRAAFMREPDWQLPFLAKPLLRAPLRRPFQGPGALFAMRVSETPEGVTLVERQYRFAVRESFIVRWLGGFGGGMATVFRAGAEAEADRFMGECLWALRDDLVAQATSGSPPDR